MANTTENSDDFLPDEEPVPDHNPVRKTRSGKD